MQSKIIITGNVGQNVDFREYEKGARASFTLACTPRIRRNGEYVDGTTTWYRVTCWRRLAHNVLASINKGDPVIVSGTLSHHQYIGTKGDERFEFTIDADFVGHDLNWGTGTFSRPARPTEPFESDEDAERARDQEERFLALVGAGPDDVMPQDPEPELAPF